MKVRSFLAFDISDKMRTELSQIIALLSAKAKDVKWVSPEKMHCTVRFFGDVEEGLLLGDLSAVIEREVKHQSPIHLLGRGVGAFPNWRYPRVLWAGLAGEAEAMISLHTRLENIFETFGFEKDPRAFRLHLTLGRARAALKNPGALMQVVEKLSERQFGELDIASLTLYKSALTREGSIYTVLRSFKFGGT